MVLHIVDMYMFPGTDRYRCQSDMFSILDHRFSLCHVLNGNFMVNSTGSMATATVSFPSMIIAFVIVSFILIILR